MKIDKSLPNNICALPWTAVHYKGNGRITPCCDFGGGAQKVDDQNLNEIFTGININEYKNSRQLTEIKDKFLQGVWPDGCLYCKKQEEETGHSRRIQETSNFLGHTNTDALTKENLLSANKFFYLNIGLSNKCNLGCITCNPGNSSYLEREQLQNSQHFLKNIDIFKRFEFILPNVKDETIKASYVNNDWTSKDIEDLVNTIDTNGYWQTRVTFHGGEPSIMKEPHSILTKIKEKGFQDKVEIEFNSNFFQYNTKWFQPLVDFRGHAMISVDAVGEPGEYIRYPSKWETVEKNILRFKEEHSNNFRITICPTIQVANIFYIEELIDWCYKHDLGLTLGNLLQWPKQLAINNLPKEVKEELIDKIQNKNYQQSYDRDERPGIINLLNQNPVTTLVRTKHLLNKIDNVRGTNWKTSLSRLYDIIK